ncbi:MAG: hypothetical protein ACWA44_09205 [Thiotrichales bacterium]
MAQDNDNIPTLDEVIFPGQPEKVSETQEMNAPTASETTPGISPSIRERLEATHGGESSGKVRAKTKQGNFESLITQQIDTILQKHMEAAREEIVRVVMLELRSRLPSANKRPKS